MAAKRKTSAPVGETSNSVVMEMHRHSSFSSSASNYTDHDVSVSVAIGGVVT